MASLSVYEAPGRSSRRGFLAGSLALAASAGLTRPAHAVGRVSMGDSELITVSDGTLTLPMGFLFPDVPKDELQSFLIAQNMPTDALHPGCNVTLLRQKERLAIFDVGSGANFMPSAGMLIDNLAAADIDPDSVTDVVFTHAHPDHLWGVTDDLDELVFANARYHIGQAEWDFWSSPNALQTVSPDRQTFVVGAQNRFAALTDRIAFLKPGREILSGVEVIDTAGHTPGHLSFMVHGSGDQTLIAGDALSNTAISFRHPEWRMQSDHDPERGVAMRRQLLARLAGDKARIIGYHFDHEGIGRVERREGAYAFVPAA
ncbi:MBL fold metallo-hydrolase [Neorhizobium petrolearium]|uniref:MBL fold metallo-hydrolase n=1 Tax=Neorhizobium petrolearium TaxID=515361 RepID=UPI003F7F14BA